MLANCHDVIDGHGEVRYVKKEVMVYSWSTQQSQNELSQSMLGLDRFSKSLAQCECIWIHAIPSRQLLCE